MGTADALPGVPALGTADDTLTRIAPRRFLRGFANLLGNEARAWWGTRKWLIHAAIWVAIINGFTGLLAWAQGREGVPPVEMYAESVQTFFIIGGIAAALGVVATTQGAIVGEKQRGTAAWLMSKPTSRGAFVLAKLVAHAGAFLALAIALPATVFCAQTLIRVGGLPPLMPFAVGLAVLALHLLFYLTITLMLGTLLDTRGPIVGVGVGLIIAGQSLPHLIPRLGTVLPWRLPWAAAGLVLGERVPMEAFIAMGATAAWAMLFVAVALWRFAREEF